jgi:hypothetical protein
LEVAAMKPSASASLVIVLLATAPVHTEAGNGRCPQCDEVVRRAVSLLPARPSLVVVLDVNEQPRALQQRLENVDAFVIPGEPTIYLKKQGSAFRRALERSGIRDYMLAATIWHEMAHVGGADEPEARRIEERLWRQFITGRQVESAHGLAYLARLRERR